MVTIFHIQEKENGKKYKLEVIGACILKDSNLWRKPQASHHNYSTLHVGDGNSGTIPYILEKNSFGMVLIKTWCGCAADVWTMGQLIYHSCG